MILVKKSKVSNEASSIARLSYLYSCDKMATDKKRERANSNVKDGHRNCRLSTSPYSFCPLRYGGTFLEIGAFRFDSTIARRPETAADYFRVNLAAKKKTVAGKLAAPRRCGADFRLGARKNVVANRKR